MSKPRPAVCVVLASEGYGWKPDGEVKKGAVITGVEEAKAAGGADLEIFHAGTRLEGNKLVTAGGRVLGVTARGQTLAAAREKAYEAVKLIRFDGMQVRKDIGK